MIKFALLPFAGALAFAGLILLLDASPALFSWGQLLWEALAVAGCIAGARVFHRGEFLWWAWAMNGSSFFLAVVKRTLGPAGLDLPSSGGPTALLAINVAMNLLAVGAAALFTLAFLRSGLGFLPGSSLRKALIVAAAAVVCVVIGLPTLRQDLAQLSGAASGYEALVSLAGDVLCFLAAAPLVHIALELRGGALSTTWWLLGASNLGWLLSDFAQLSSSPGTGRTAGELLLCFTCLCVLGAGLAHRRAAGALRPAAVEEPSARAA